MCQPLLNDVFILLFYNFYSNLQPDPVSSSSKSFSLKFDRGSFWWTVRRLLKNIPEIFQESFALAKKVCSARYWHASSFAKCLLGFVRSHFDCQDTTILALMLISVSWWRLPLETKVLLVFFRAAKHRRHWKILLLSYFGIYIFVLLKYEVGHNRFIRFILDERFIRFILLERQTCIFVCYSYGVVIIHNLLTLERSQLLKLKFLIRKRAN